MKTVEFIYPEFTNIYGESYNMEYLKRCNPEISIYETHHGETPLFVSGKADMVYLGCMTEEKQELALNLLKPYVEEIRKNISSGTIFLVTGNAIELFGKEISGDEVISDRHFSIEALGIFDFTSKRSMQKMRHNSQYIGTFGDMTLMGHRSQYSMSYGSFDESFIDIEVGIGMNPETKKEGIHVNNFFGTYSLGPYLVLNPWFTKYLLRLMGLDDHLSFEKEIIEASEYRLSELKKTLK